MSEKSPAPIESWDPFRELDLFRGWPSLSMMGARPVEGASKPVWSPSMDVSETETHYIATVELAGAKKEDVHVEVQDGVLTVHGEKRSEREEENDQRRYTERSFGSFSRSITLPRNAMADDIKATFTDGVLEIKIAKGNAPGPKPIEVE